MVCWTISGGALAEIDVPQLGLQSAGAPDCDTKRS
jgi:hypothetical protein